MTRSTQPVAADHRSALEMIADIAEGSRTANSLPHIAKIARDALSALQRAPDRWRTDFENAPTEAYDYFLVRPRGIHQSFGKPFHPTIVQRIDGTFYSADNELDPVYFGQDEEDGHPLQTKLEWHPFPADWLVASPAIVADNSEAQQ